MRYTVGLVPVHHFGIDKFSPSVCEHRLDFAVSELSFRPSDVTLDQRVHFVLVLVLNWIDRDNP